MKVADEHRVRDTYIVKMKEGFSSTAADFTVTSHMNEAKHVYGSTNFRGFASQLNATSLEALRASPHVSSNPPLVFQVYK